jgi:hypothetical protein
MGVAIAACSSKSDPTKENFANAVQTRLDSIDAACVVSGAIPFDLPDFHNYPQTRADALVKVGLLSKQPTTVQSGIQTVPGSHYSLTDVGRKAVRTANPVADSRLCGGKAKVVEITSSTSAPEKVEIGTSVLVRYTGKLVDRPLWDDEAALSPFFPELLSTTNDQFNNENILTLTKDGWTVTH